MSARPAYYVISVFFLKYSAPTEIYPLSLHDALPIWTMRAPPWITGRSVFRLLKNSALRFEPSSPTARNRCSVISPPLRSEEHTSELQSLRHLVCRLLLEKKKTNRRSIIVKKTNIQT